MHVRNLSFTLRGQLNLAIAVALVVVGTLPVTAQEPQADLERSSTPAADVVKGVAFDPTTYAPAALLFESMRLDWRSSQPLFQHGFVEGNPHYTLTGLPHDAPVSYAVGNRRTLTDSLAILPTSLLHNATNRTIERLLIGRFPNHRKLLRTIGWIERSAFASYLSYQLSVRHFEQWRTNERLSRDLGYE